MTTFWINFFVYLTVLLVTLTVLILIIGSVKGMIQSGFNIKKMVLKTIPILMCITPCLIILGVAMYNLFIMMLGNSSAVQISDELESLCCIAGTWVSGVLIGFGILVILTGGVKKLIRRRT